MALTEVTHGWHCIYLEQRCSQTLVFKMQVVGSEINSVVLKNTIFKLGQNGIEIPEWHYLETFCLIIHVFRPSPRQNVPFIF